MIFNISGKKWEPKEEVKPAVQDDDVPLETEWDDVLAQATEEELVDLAGNDLFGTSQCDH